MSTNTNITRSLANISNIIIDWQADNGSHRMNEENLSHYVNDSRVPSV